MRVRFRPEARDEALEAKAWYERCSPGLGLEFARALEATVQSVLRAPLTYRILEGECRCSFLRRFPYSLVYRPEPDGILVVAVFHHRRDPATWHDRVARKPDSRPG